jgi:hypothetical protein
MRGADDDDDDGDNNNNNNNNILSMKIVNPFVQMCSISPPSRLI